MNPSENLDMRVLGEIGEYQIVSPPPDLELESDNLHRPAILLFVDKAITPSFVGVTASAEIIEHEKQNVSLAQAKNILNAECILCSRSLDTDNMYHTRKWTFSKMGYHKELLENKLWYPLASSSYLLICPDCTTTVENVSQKVIDTHTNLLVSLQV